MLIQFPMGIQDPRAADACAAQPRFGIGSRADLHVHSKYSDRPAEWFLRRIGAPECFVEPRHVYQTARERGMDFVTISDHNSIAGALEIANLHHTFLSAEVTTYFPEDGCKIHCLVTGISEAQFRMIQELRANIYELQRYLVDEDILCSVTHPLFRVNDRLTVDHVEKLLLLFNRFEAINGSRDGRAAALVQAVFRNLTPAMIEAMADHHGFAPLGPEPWNKCFTGGSDDHSGVHVAAAYTITPRAESVAQFLAHLRAGRHEAAGASGGSLLLARSLYHIAYSYYKNRILGAAGGSSTLLGALFERLLGDAGPRPAGRFARFVPGFVTSFVRARRMRKLNDVERCLVEEFSTMFCKEGAAAEGNGTDGADERRTFELACRIGHTLGYRFLRKFEEAVREGRLLDSLQTISSLAPVLLGLAPYLAAFSAQHKDEAFLQAVAAHFSAARRLARRSGGKAWITDTFSDTNGVCYTIRNLAREAKRQDKRLAVLTCLDHAPVADAELINFQPVGNFLLPEYESQEVAFPPFLEVLECIERQAFSELIISTPGPMGLAALAAARLLGLRTAGIYHTDFPLLVRHVTRDPAMEQLTWKYIAWFYSQLDVVLAPSPAYRRHLVNNGFDPRRVAVVEHGVDPDRFHPGNRDPRYWRRRGLAAGFTFLYVGRISPEKDLDRLIAAFQRIDRSKKVNLAIVGDGPSLAELQAQAKDPRIAFTGRLLGDDLAAAYASADALVFPSQADTFGLAVLEALASGLPAIVSACGGPADLVRRHDAGLVVDLALPDALVAAMERLAGDPRLCMRFRAAALRTAAENTWARVFADFWDHCSDPASNTVPVYRTAGPEAGADLIVMDVA